MNLTNQSFDEHSVSGWQLLGELKLSNDLDVEITVHEWLLEIINPLDLNVDFFNKLTLSMQGVAMSLLKSGLETQEFDHIHLLVFAQRKQKKKPHSWGFFRIKKLESLIKKKGLPDRVVEFYLYPE